MHHLWNICCYFTNLISSFYKGVHDFLGKYKKQALAVLFLALEATSTVVDLFGKSRSSFLVAAFLLSAFGFALTIYTTCFIERTQPRAQRQLRVVEIVFSFVQLIATFVHFIIGILGGNKYNYNLSLFPLAFAIIAAVFYFKKNEFEDGLYNNPCEDQELCDYPREYYPELHDDPWEDYQDGPREDYHELHDGPWEDYEELHDDSWDYQERCDDLWDYNYGPEPSNDLRDYQEPSDDDLWDYQEPPMMMTCGIIVIENYMTTRGTIKRFAMISGIICQEELYDDP
ncbi:hypothetical protein Dsin_032118 [Dipteronia sinensis]|uniref:Uncharacterized protein n=1 Tax=Dipteronia sinensis TaxID=43782 RepID=A0AAE0DT10_9ROSI|nr:hypothetical protein Dsin_032118 [Dipteronia sinensis]